MKEAFLFISILLSTINGYCQPSTEKTMKTPINPLLCDPEIGICEIPANTDSAEGNIPSQAEQQRVKIIYFTDPICSSCWGIEPQLRKLKLEYGHAIEIEYHMGGLLKDWTYNSGGISKPSDVAHHWDEVSEYYDMPIDGDVWLEDPLPSSYPPSIAFKAAQMQDNKKAIDFLRKIREMVFLQKKNITHWEHLEAAAQSVGLDVQTFKQDYEGTAKVHFEADLALSRQLGVRGFPTIFFTDSKGQQEKVYGTKPYEVFEKALLKLNPDAAKVNYEKSGSFVFSKYPSLTAKEFSELTESSRTDAETFLDTLVAQGKLEKLITKNGSLWTLK